MKFGSIFIALALFLGGCRIFTDWNDGRSSGSAVSITNETQYDLYVTAMTEDVLALARIASAIHRDQVDGDVLHPTESMLLPFDSIGGEFGPGAKVVFIVYSAPRDENVFHLARMLHTTYEELAFTSFTLGITPEHLTYDHLFGDAYRILTTEQDEFSGTHPPRLVDGTLELWVSFSGCDEGVFTLSSEVKDDDAVLTLFHDYPDSDFDCERLNVKELTFELSDGVLGQPGIILLNPNRGSDPYADAFQLKP